MPVVNIRQMLVLVRQAGMNMRMGMPSLKFTNMNMSMMFIRVAMGVFVGHFRVNMIMLVFLIYQ